MQIKIKDDGFHMLKVLRSPHFRFGAAFAIVVGLLIWIVLISIHPVDPIPQSIRSGVSFPVYYPEQSRLPAGLSLVQNSTELISPGVVILRISINQSDSMVISEESMPQQSVITEYNSENIPLHDSFSTPFGQATYGAYNNNGSLRSVVSLPIRHGPWLIITAPANIDKAEFEKIIDSLTET